MKAIEFKYIILLGFLMGSLNTFSQCEVSNRLLPDGTMYYYMEPVNFYWTKAKSLKGNIVTDKENYFLALQPIPFPQKAKGKKLKSDLELKLSNGKSYRMVHYDTRYLEKDTIMELLFLIDKKDLNDVTDFEAIEATIDMKGDEGLRKYVFKLHRKALQEQLTCFRKEEEKKNK